MKSISTAFKAVNVSD